MEGKVARDADKLDMVLQAAAYEKAGRRGLDEFWEGARRHDWHLPDSAALVRRLVEARDTDASGTP
jgi:5'-deoxynucleotidase YfbR-like HD superfamily hydrolase